MPGQFTIAYAKIIHDASDDISLDGPFVTRSYDEVEAAETAARQLTKEHRDEIVIKVYDKSLLDGRQVIELAKDHFNSVLHNMRMAAELNKRPIHKRKKRRLQQ